MAPPDHTRRSAPAAAPHEYADDRRGPRLQKVLAEAGVGSRRGCETIIEAGEVAVNGTVIRHLPAWVDPLKDRITIRGRHLRAPEDPVYVMLFKPRGVVCTNDDPDGRRRAIDLVRHPSRARLFPIGRLDLDSSGLLLLTNDGEFANRLAHPRYHLPKVYEVTVRGSLDVDEVRRLERGLFLPDRRTGQGRLTSHSRLRLLKRDRDRTRLRLELREGRNRQVRRMMLAVGHPVKKLRRIQLGSLRLRDLRPGQWRDLTPREVQTLRKVAFRRSE